MTKRTLQGRLERDTIPGEEEGEDVVWIIRERERRKSHGGFESRTELRSKGSERNRTLVWYGKPVDHPFMVGGTCRF